jgi:GNAT superfamily N-acetyltransferase
MNPQRSEPAIRSATLDDLEAVLALQHESFRQFGEHDYPRAVLEASLAHMGTMDPRMIRDGTYLLAELDGALAGCAGWSTRKLPYARLLQGGMPALPPDCGRCGSLRSLYVAPKLWRRGVGRALLAAVESRLDAAGVETVELLSALPGEAFFAVHGYVTLSTHAFQLADGLDFTMRRMARLIRGEVTPDPGAAAAPYRPEAAAG